MELDLRLSLSNFLDAFHSYAATADFEKYFTCFSPIGRFLGTDATENWTRDEFMEFSRPHFNGECAWNYVPNSEQRIITFVNIGESVIAAFDESLLCVKLNCPARGSGSAIFDTRTSTWQILYYHLSFPIPNDIAVKINNIITLFHDQQNLLLKEKVANDAADNLLKELGLEVPNQNSKNLNKKNKSKK